MIADALAFHLTAHACLDAGGRYDSVTGDCSGTIGHVAPFSRPGNTAFWLLFLTPILGVAVGIYGIIAWALARTFRDSEVSGALRN